MIDINSLNEAQREAVLSTDRSVLVIAGAGSGKTRTVVHRIAWLYEQGINPQSMLLLTFTRKAANEMLHRAADLLGQSLHNLHGGTFHGFAYSILRSNRPTWANGNITILDSADSVSVINTCKDDLKLGKGDRSFPRSNNILSFISKARNKELALEEIINKDAAHLGNHTEALCDIAQAYNTYRQNHNLVDYDDLLFELESLIMGNEKVRAYLHERFKYIMVDEYQDTNKVQARLTKLLTNIDDPKGGSIMAVGDDAQSIYAFRGATVRNILDFPKIFPDTKIIRLEENYRSTQNVLNIANNVLQHSVESFDKKLFTNKTGGNTVRVVRPFSDFRQADIVANRINELLEDYMPNEIAVLFRAGYQSYRLEIALSRLGIKFNKYGGQRYTDAAHNKDVISYMRLLVNPLDMPSLERVASLCKGIGKKTAQKIFALIKAGDNEGLNKLSVKYPSFVSDLKLLDDLRNRAAAPDEALRIIVDNYRPILEAEYSDDWPRRLQGLEELKHIASSYKDIESFVSDLVLEAPENKDENDIADKIVLSTIHSAKGLEWDVVFIMDLVEDRFPSKYSMLKPEEFEEERRLMYVACTRARDRLELYVPQSIQRFDNRGSDYALESPFINELPKKLYDEWQENYQGAIKLKEKFSTYSLANTPNVDTIKEVQKVDKKPNNNCGFCHHKIFGRGKIIEHIEPDKCRVNFQGIGLKVILKDYLSFE